MTALLMTRATTMTTSSAVVAVRLIGASEEEVRQAVAQLQAALGDVLAFDQLHAGRRGDWLAYGTLHLAAQPAPATTLEAHAALLLERYHARDGSHDDRCYAAEQALMAAGMSDDDANDLLDTFEDLLEAAGATTASALTITAAQLAARHRASLEAAEAEAYQERGLNRP